MQLVTLRPDATVLQVLETFRNNNILSAPFVDESGNCFGSIDMLDIIAYACQKLNLTKSQDIIKDQLQLMQEFLKRPVMGLKDLSNRNPWISLPSRKSLKRAILLLSNPKFHRVFIQEENRVLGVMTQSKAVELILEHKDEAARLLKMRLNELFPESRQSKFIDSRSTIAEAIVKLHIDGVSGLAVIDNNSVLVGNFSATDLLKLNFADPRQFIEHLQLPLDKFLADRKPVTLKPSDTLETALELVKSNKIHRLYVTDEKNRPLEVLSLGDLLGQFLYMDAWSTLA